MSLELGAIIAIAMAITSTLCEYLRIPKKLKSWIVLLLIIALNLGNEALFQPGSFDWRKALFRSITAGLATVGIYSTGKNTWEQWMLFRNGNGNGNGNTHGKSNGNGSPQKPPDQYPYV